MDIGEIMDAYLIGMLVIALAVTIAYCIAMLRFQKKNRNHK
jgi:hypothetical protein